MYFMVLRVYISFLETVCCDYSRHTFCNIFWNKLAISKIKTAAANKYLSFLKIRTQDWD